MKNGGVKVVIRITVNLEDLLSSRKSSFQLLLCNYAKKKINEDTDHEYNQGKQADKLKQRDTVVFSCSVVSESLRPHGLQHASFPDFHHLLEFAQIHVH